MKILATLAMASFAAIAVAETPERADSFLHEAAQGSMADIQAGQLAENNGTSEVVRRFGAMMVEQHTNARDKVEALAKRKNVELPKAPSEEQRETLDKLQAADGPRFDQEYVAEMVRAHERTLEMLESEIASGRDADTKALAQELLPTAQSHLREAYRLAGKEEQATRLPK
jgi:putative membrane protein